MAKGEIQDTFKKISTENRRHFKYRSSQCLNCEQPLDLSDVYCPHCSQLNTTKPLSLKDFLNEFLGSIISYDSRFRHTIKDVLFHPGRITRKYVNGQRVRYANPFRFFLSVSIVYFLLNSLFTNFNDEANDFKEGWINSTIEDSIKQKNNIYFDDEILNVEGKKNSIENNFENYFISEDSLSKMGYAQRAFERFSMYNSFHEEHKEITANQALDSLKQEQSRYNIWLYNKTLRAEQIQKNPQEYIQYLITKIPFFLFFLAPIYALFFWLLYYRNKHRYIEHLIFIFHIFTFLFLVMLLVKLPDLLLGNNYLISVLFFLIAPFYFYKALRNYYKQSRWKTILKFVLLNFTFFIVTSFAMIAFIFGTAAIY